MKRITILAAAGALLAFPAIGSPAAFAATDDSPAAHVRVPAKHGGNPGPVVTLPAGVPLPPGVVTAFGRGPGRWSILEVVNGSAKQAQASAVAFYVRHGFHRDTAHRVHGRGYRISMIAENRDHSATKSNLTVVITRQT